MKLSTVTLLAFLTAASGKTLRTVSSFDEKQTFEITKPLPEEESCACRTDYDCRSCPYKPICIVSDRYGTGTCGVKDTGGPEPTPAPVASSPTDCCPDPKSIPTKCEVEILIDLLDIAVSSNHRLAPQWLRLSFHDAGTFNTVVDEGGANGCLMTTSHFRQEAENAFLDLPINTLQAIKSAWEAHPDTCIKVSAADIIQFAGRFGAIRQAGSATTAGILTTAKKDDLLQFEWGREDEQNCDVAWVENLPGFSLGSPSGNIPLRCLNAGHEIKEKMMERNGFTAEESAALIGAHTIGKTRFTFGTGSLSNPWVENGGDNATPNGPVFDRAFHKFLDDIPANTVADFAIDQDPFDVLFPDWHMDNTAGGLNHLDTDVVLAFPSQDTGVHPHFHTFTQAFAANNNFFLQTFFEALDKMSKLGVDELLKEPTECTPCDEGGGITTGEVVQLVSELGTASSDADDAVKEFEATAEFSEKLEFQTTEVTKEEILDPKQADAELKQEITQITMDSEEIKSGKFLN